MYHVDGTHYLIFIILPLSHEHRKFYMWLSLNKIIPMNSKILILDGIND